MRKIILGLIAVAGLFKSTHAQVGIGTTSPSNSLHVKNTSDPMRLEGLKVADSSYAGKVMVVSNTGIVKYASLETLMKNSAHTGPIKSTSTNYTLDSSDNIVIITSGNPTITLPAPNQANGRVYHIMSLVTGKCNYSTSLTVHNGTVSDINGKSSDTIISDGTKWYRLHHTN